MKRILVCQPDYYDVKYSINFWMESQDIVNNKEAVNQWNFLVETLQNIGCDIQRITPQADLPDMVFTANGALCLSDLAILPRFTHLERRGEEDHFENYFKENGYRTFKPGNLFEGAGDSLVMGDYLFCGYGFRSHINCYEELMYITDKKIILCQLVDKRFYHLDTCFCPLTDDTAICYKDAFSKDSYENISRVVKFLINVPEEEAERFVCNSVVVGNKIVMPYKCQKTAELLSSIGFEVYPCNMDEYLKAGGACKCLTLDISK